MYPSRTAARLLFIPTPVKTFIGPLPGTPTDHLGLQSWPSSSPSLPLTTTICHPSSSHIYCSIASFDLFYFFYILSFFLFFFFSREGRSLFYADWCTRWWMTFHFTKPRHSPIPCQPKAGSVLIFTQDLPHEGSMLQAGIKYTMRTEAMYVWELCDGKQTYIFFFFFLWLLTSALTWHSFSGIPQSTTVGPATIEPRFFDIFLTTHTRFHTQFSSLIVLR